MTGAQLLLVIVLAAPFIGSAAAASLRPHARNAAAWLATAASGLTLACGIGLYPALAAGEIVTLTLPWAPSLGLTFALRADGFAWLFLLLISGIGMLVSVYARYYMSPADPVPRFFSLLLAFAGAMVGVVLSGNVIQLVIFWEMTSILSFLLIGYWHHGAAARDGARMALVVTSTGGLCLLVGLLLLGAVAGSYELDAILAAGPQIRASHTYGPALLLILIGAFTKSAQFPFHFWLPNAMAAPTPVSAYLHSATMVKAGVFLLVRFWPVLSDTALWFWLVGTAGLTTLTLGAYLAMFQRDMKAVLAYSTISHLGLITFLLGLGSPLACVAAIFHIVNHAVFKASLFMAAGAVDHEAGTRDLKKLGGLARHMPLTCVLACVSAAAMAGVPLLNGFLSKEMFFEETLAARTGSGFDILPTLAVVAASAFAVVYSLRLVALAFFGPPPESYPKPPHEPPRWMLAPIACLALTCVAVGVLPSVTIQPFLALAADSVLGDRAPQFTLAIWHGLTPALAMSAIAMTIGLAAYGLLHAQLRRWSRPPVLGALSAARMFEAGMRLITEQLPNQIKMRFPAEKLQPQLLLIVVTGLVAAGLSAWVAPINLPGLSLGTLDPPFALLWAIGGACAIAAAAFAKFHRLAALVLAGGAGLASCISFVWLSAPDLATTQLLVEVVTAILLLLGLRWLPPRLRMEGARRPADRMRRARDLAIAVAAGIGMSVLAYGVMMHPVAGSISEYFLQNAYSGGGGRNVVNVILVDFRALDTLGEITVLAIVALSVFALLRRFRPSEESMGAPVQQTTQAALDAGREGRDEGDTLTEYLRVPGLIVRLMFPVVVLLALHLFLRGHDLPGGGFSAGLTGSVALILLYMAGGVRWVEARFRVAPVRWMGAGLVLAFLTGAVAMLLGYPFLTSDFRYLEIPLLGRAPLASAMLFDLGVFMLVVGATTLILITLAHQSQRRPRRTRPTPSDEIARSN